MARRAEIQRFFRVLGSGFEREYRVDVRFRRGLAMRTSGTAGLGASAQSLLNDALDGAGAPATFGAAAEAAIELLGIARKIVGGAHGIADIMVGQDVAGANDHGVGRGTSTGYAHRYGRPQPIAKGKQQFERIPI